MTETIVACATSTGYSSIAVIRLSGDRSVPYLRQVFIPADSSQDVTANRTFYGRITDPGTGEVIDAGMATVFFQPNSYTGEDVVELSCHGNPLIVNRIIAIFISLGARLANPGEFTRRALFNGKIDLLQAEAVADIVRANSDLARKIAVSHYEGKLSEKIEAIKSQIVDLLKIVEACIDFPEEEDVPCGTEDLHDRLNEVLSNVYDLLSRAQSGMKIREGYGIVIAGKPNVGKSTLFNRLLGFERAIVHESPGTTRDYVEEGLEMNGIYLRITDTAGFMLDAVGPDRIASDKATEVLKNADLVLLVFDGSEPLDERDTYLYEATKGKTKILIINKIDLNQQLKESEMLSDSVKISAKNGDNLEMLKQRISMVFKPEMKNSDVFLTRRRHIQALKDIKKCILSIQDNNYQEPEMIAFELHEALDIIGEITGKVMRKEILDKIFDEFCIGK